MILTLEMRLSDEGFHYLQLPDGRWVCKHGGWVGERGVGSTKEDARSNFQRELSTRLESLLYSVQQTARGETYVAP
jgi:hypothetical protein